MGDEAIRAYVLVIEDTEPNARLLCRLLRLDGYVVQSVGDGATALASITQQTPDLILLDSDLPAMSGLEVCQILRSRDATRLTPIIFLTGMNTSELESAAIAAGADQFVAKPYNSAELRGRVRGLLQLKRHTDELQAMGFRSGPPTQEA
jgi:putative two-component system response regulator